MSRIKTIDVTKEYDKRREQQKECLRREFLRTAKAKKELKLDIETLEEKIPQAIRGEFYFSAEKLSELIEEKTKTFWELTAKEREAEIRLQETEESDGSNERDPSAVLDWGEEFLHADTATKRMILSSFIDKIIVKNEEIVIKLKVKSDGFCAETVGFGVPE